MFGTHNSMTYLKPVNRIGKIFNFIGKCQTIDIFQQIKCYKCIDLRISFDKNGNIEFRHGLIIYMKEADTFFYKIIKYANHHKRIVRLILENNNNNGKDKFYRLCKSLTYFYNNITFIGGYLKPTWEKIYDFNDKNITINQYVSSMAKDVKWYEKLCPKLYAKRMNKYNKLHSLLYDINLFDFIEL